jgi:AbrB family looped-hinge helix DNA binding protein
MLSKVNAKGQVTIPKPIRDALGIGPNDRVAFMREGERVLLQPLRTLKAFRGAVKMSKTRQQAYREFRMEALHDLDG